MADYMDYEKTIILQNVNLQRNDVPLLKETSRCIPDQILRKRVLFSISTISVGKFVSRCCDSLGLHQDICMEKSGSELALFMSQRLLPLRIFRDRSKLGRMCTIKPEPGFSVSSV